MLMKRLFLLLLLMSAANGAAAGPQENVAHGKALVEANCAGCHGVGTGDKSRHPDAPEFRTLGERYPIDALEEAFVEGIYTGHPDMPNFTASPEQVEDIIDYIESLQGR